MNIRTNNNAYRNLCLILEGIVVGTIVFWMMYGFGPLDVTNDRWIMSGYDETDIIQHYAGWCGFRSSSWHLPLGLADNMAGGTFISYTDSLPWLAVFFKFVLQILHYDGTFQYFGIYAFLCYVLQAVATGFLIRRITSNHFVICVCMVLLCFSPVLMEKSLRHTALGSHWMLLFAMYAYLKFMDRQCKKFPISFGVLAVLSVGIHPYFLPLVLVFSFLSLLSCFYRKTNIFRNSCGFIISILLPLASGYLIGALGTGVDISRWGYGYWNMNLNAPFNPISLGGYVWSSFLKVHPLALGNLNENTYMGFGYLCLVFLAAISFIVIPPRWSRRSWPDVITYIVITVFMTAFALSNVVVFNDKKILEIPLPDKILYLCGIFRASPRMFYFTYYSLVIFSLYRIYDVINNLKVVDIKTKDERIAPVSRSMTAYFVVFIICFVQYIDVSQVVTQKHAVMSEKIRYASILDDQNLTTTVKGKRYLISDTADRSLQVFAGKNHLATSFSIANSYQQKAGDEAKKAMKIMDQLAHGIHNDGLVVAFRDISLAKDLYKNKNVRSSCRYIESNGFAFIIADRDTTNLSRDSSELVAASLSDDIWSRGIWKSGNIILFPYSDELLAKLNNGVRFIEDIQGNSAVIINFEAMGRDWIKVGIDRDAKIYQYPKVARLKY